MKLSSTIHFAIILLLLIACRNRSDEANTPLYELEQLSIENMKIDNPDLGSFVISCGGGCALTYTGRHIAETNGGIEVDFMVERWNDGVIIEDYIETFEYKCYANSIIEVKLKIDQEFDYELPLSLVNELMNYEAVSCEEINTNSTVEGKDYFTFEKLYSESEQIGLPMEYSYELILNMEGFTPMDVPVVTNLPNLRHFQFATLPDYNEIKLLLYSGYLENGEVEIHLSTLNSAFEQLDDLLLYTYQEAEDNTRAKLFSINDDHTIKVWVEEVEQGSTEIIQEEILTINSNGRFIPLKP